MAYAGGGAAGVAEVDTDLEGLVNDLLSRLSKPDKNVVAVSLLLSIQCPILPSIINRIIADPKMLTGLLQGLVALLDPTESEICKRAVKTLHQLSRNPSMIITNWLIENPDSSRDLLTRDLLKGLITFLNPSANPEIGQDAIKTLHQLFLDPRMIIINWFIKNPDGLRDLLKGLVTFLNPSANPKIGQDAIKTLHQLFFDPRVIIINWFIKNPDDLRDLLKGLVTLLNSDANPEMGQDVIKTLHYLSRNHQVINYLFSTPDDLKFLLRNLVATLLTPSTKPDINQLAVRTLRNLSFHINPDIIKKIDINPTILQNLLEKLVILLNSTDSTMSKSAADILLNLSFNVDHNIIKDMPLATRKHLLTTATPSALQGLLQRLMTLLNPTEPEICKQAIEALHSFSLDSEFIKLMTTPEILRDLLINSVTLLHSPNPEIYIPIVTILYNLSSVSPQVKTQITEAIKSAATTSSIAASLVASLEPSGGGAAGGAGRAAAAFAHVATARDASRPADSTPEPGEHK